MVGWGGEADPGINNGGHGLPKEGNPAPIRTEKFTAPGKHAAPLHRLPQATVLQDVSARWWQMGP